MTSSKDRGRSGRTRRFAGLGVLLAGAAALATLGSCTKQSPPPQKPLVTTTKAFDAVYGELPSLPLQADSFATVAYFPSSVEPKKFLPVPVFVVEPGKEENLVVRTVIRGFEGEGGPVEELVKEILYPFPQGSELVSLSYEGGEAKIVVGGKFRAGSLSSVQKEKAAGALALTVSQFGKADRVEVADESGKVRFRGEAGGTETVDIGPPRALGLMAIRESGDRPPGVLSVLFDRPVFVEDAAFYPPGGSAPYPGKVYSTGFGMTLELHPDPKTVFDPALEYRVRLAVRDGKGRRAEGMKTFIPMVVSRH